MKVYVTKVDTFIREVKFEVEIPDDTLERHRKRQKEDKGGPWPLREEVEKVIYNDPNSPANLPQGLLKLADDPDGTIDWCGTAYQVFIDKDSGDSEWEWDIG